MPVIIAIILFFVGFHFTQDSKQNNTTNRTIASVNDITGELLAEADDINPNHKKHKINYFIQDSKNLLHNIEPSNVDEQMIGSKVSFKKEIGENPNSGTLIPRASRIRVPYVNEHKMLILLFKFNNSMTEYTTAEEVQKSVFTGAFQRFYREISDKKETHTGRVYGFYHLNRNGDDDGGADMPCNVSNDEIKQAANHYQIDLTQYTQVTTVSNCTEYATIGGRANLSAFDFLGIGKKQHYIRMAVKPDAFKLTGQHPYVPGWGGFISILIHERGHNFGLQHSNGLDCNESKTLYPCLDVEYGNRFDRMGGPSGSFLFNAYQQEKAGWKKPSEFLHIKEAGTYSIDRITSTHPNRKIGAYIYNPQNLNQKLFMLEFRTPHGMDNNLSNPDFSNIRNGAHLYTAFGPSTITNSPAVGTGFRIVDPNPTSSDWSDDTRYDSLQGSYIDVRSGLKITTIQAYPEKIEFKVEFDPSLSVCGKSPLNEWSTKPYLKLYYELDVQNAVQIRNGDKPNSDGSNSPFGGSNLTPPAYSKEIKRNHIVLVPGDFFHLKIDTLPGDPMICERTAIEVEVLNYLELQNYFTESMLSNHFKKTTKNIPQKIEFPLFKVPSVELNKDKIIQYRVKNKVTGETDIRELHLHIRSSHNAIIPIKSMQVR